VRRITNAAPVHSRSSIWRTRTAEFRRRRARPGFGRAAGSPVRPNANAHVLLRGTEPQPRRKCRGRPGPEAHPTPHKHLEWVRFKLPCRDSNPGHRPMAYPQKDKVDRRLVQARTAPVWPDVDATAGRPCRGRSGRRAGHVPACKGSVDASAYPDMGLPGTGGRQYVRVSSPRLPGEAPVPERQHGAPVPSPT
jgi:hypothetical protein